MITGKYQIDILHEGTMRVDGGVVFAGMPRCEWEAITPPDDKNKISLGINQLLIRGSGINMLVDTGIGNKIRPRKRELMGIETSASLCERLKAYGLTPADITHVVFSHLHYDHCGGATEAIDDDIRPVFPAATFFIQKDEWSAARNPDEISRSSYCLHDFLPLYETGRIKFINGDCEIEEGIFLEVTGGHTAAHQLIRIEDTACRLIYPADICPTPFHLAPERREAFDLFPSATLQARKTLLRRAMRADTLFAFSHSCEKSFFRIKQDCNSYTAVAVNEP